MGPHAALSVALLLGCCGVGGILEGAASHAVVSVPRMENWPHGCGVAAVLNWRAPPLHRRAAARLAVLRGGARDEDGKGKDRTDGFWLPGSARDPRCAPTPFSRAVAPLSRVPRVAPPGHERGSAGSAEDAWGDANPFSGLGAGNWEHLPDDAHSARPDPGEGPRQAVDRAPPVPLNPGLEEEERWLAERDARAHYATTTSSMPYGLRGEDVATADQRAVFGAGLPGGRAGAPPSCGAPAPAGVRTLQRTVSNDEASAGPGTAGFAQLSGGTGMQLCARFIFAAGGGSGGPGSPEPTTRSESAGADDGRGARRRAYRYDKAMQQWERVADMRCPRNLCSAAIFQARARPLRLLPPHSSRPAPSLPVRKYLRPAVVCARPGLLTTRPDAACRGGA
jgi:hypothetical protein